MFVNIVFVVIGHQDFSLSCMLYFFTYCWGKRSCMSVCMKHSCMSSPFLIAMMNGTSFLSLLLLLLLLKVVSSARLRESDVHPVSPKTPAPQ